MEYFPVELCAPSQEVGLGLVIDSAGLPYSSDLNQAGLWGPPQDVGLELVIAGSVVAHAFPDFVHSPIEGGTLKWPFGPGNEEAALYRVKTKN